MTYLSLRMAGAVLVGVNQMYERFGLAAHCERGHDDCALRDDGICSKQAAERIRLYALEIAAEHEAVRQGNVYIALQKRRA